MEALEGTLNSGVPGNVGNGSGVGIGRLDLESRESGLAWKVGIDGDWGSPDPVLEKLFREDVDVRAVLLGFCFFCDLEGESEAVDASRSSSGRCGDLSIDPSTDKHVLCDLSGLLISGSV